MGCKCGSEKEEHVCVNIDGLFYNVCQNCDCKSYEEVEEIGNI